MLSGSVGAPLSANMTAQEKSIRVVQMLRLGVKVTSTTEEVAGKMAGRTGL